jgi:hypothetical protein
MKTPTDIMRILKLRKLGLKAPNSPLCPIVTKYMNLFNTVDPRFKKDTLQNWLKKGLISEDDFALLTLGKSADDLLTSSQLSAWKNYVNLFNKENPTEKVSALAALTARFGDDALATMIDAAKKVPKTETMATQLQAEQIKHWLDAGKLPDGAAEGAAKDVACSWEALRRRLLPAARQYGSDENFAELAAL